MLLGLTVLAFAYLGGITSVNGAIVAGLIGTGGLIVVFSRFHFDGIEEYTAALGGASLVFTAIVHPEGLAPTFQPLLRALGRFVVSARWPQWRAAIVRLGPTALAGAVAGWLLWTRRPGFSWWMTALGAALALVLRANVVRIRHAALTRRGARGVGTEPVPVGPTGEHAVPAVSAGRSH
jgi:hypothetical protein